MMDDAGDVLRKLEPLFVYRCPQCNGAGRDPSLAVDGSCGSCGGQGIIFLAKEDIAPGNLAKRGFKL